MANFHPALRCVPEVPPPCFHGFIFPDHTLCSWINDGGVGEKAGRGKDSTLRGENSCGEVIRVDGKVRMWGEIQSSGFEVRSSKFDDRGFKFWKCVWSYRGCWSGWTRCLSIGLFAVNIGFDVCLARMRKVHACL